MFCWRNKPGDGSSRNGGTDDTPKVDVADAWQILSSTSEWVRYADAKVGVTLAFVGVTTAVLVEQVLTTDGWGWATILAATVSSFGLVMSVFFASGALFPQVDRGGKGDSTQDSSRESDYQSLIFFGDVARHFENNSVGYADSLSRLLSDKDQTVRQISEQVWINSRIALRKFEKTQRAIRAELLAVSGLAVFFLLDRIDWDSASSLVVAFFSSL